MNEFPIGLPEIGHHQRSKGFQALLHGIAAAKTKHEEDKILRKELVSLKNHLGSSKLTAKQIRELLIRLIYCEMLGHDASFGYINAIKYAEQSALLDKKTGYLAASIFLNRNHNLVCLLINTIQKDLKSTNVVAKSTVLNVICNLVDAEKIPPLLPFIVAALKDKRVEIRKKALITLKHAYQLSEDSITNIDEELRSAISDRDPIVVSAALQFFHVLIKKNLSKYRGYLKVFLQVLTQVVEGKLSEYNFHGVRAPWIQIKLLKILALLGHQNKSCSESMSPTLLNMMKSLPTDCNIGCAVMFECIKTSTTIYPIKTLLDLAAKKTTLFLTSNSSDLKCLGITAMTSLVEVNTSYAGDEKLQQVIIKCLDDDDKTIGKKILELLYRITNSENICVICQRLLDYIRSTTEQSIRNDVAKNLAQLANQYAPNITWYVDTINDVIQAADSPVQPDVMFNLIKVVAAGGSDDQRIVATQYLQLIKKTTLHESLIQMACWILGEYGILIQDGSFLDVVFSRLAALLDRKFEDSTTHGWIMTAIAKLTRHTGVYSPETNRIMDRYRTGFPAELRQRCHEINVLASDMSLMRNALPSAYGEDDVKVCSSLSFLDNFVAKALSAGALTYQQQFSNIQETSENKKAPHELRFEPYEDPFSQQLGLNKSFEQLKQTLSHVPPEKATTSSLEGNVVESLSKPAPQPTAKVVWGPSGYTGNKIKKTAEGLDKVAQSSSGRSPSGDLPVEKPSQKCEETIFQRTRENERSPPSNSNDDESPNIALFAGIKPKSKTVTSKKRIETNTTYDLQDTSPSEELFYSGTDVSGEQRLKLDLPEQNVEPEAGTGRQSREADLKRGIMTTNQEQNIFSQNTDLLFDSIGNENSQECLQPLPDVILNEDVAVVSTLDTEKEINQNEDSVRQGSLLDGDIEIDELPQTDVLKQDSAYGKDSSLNDGDYKTLCIDSNVRLVTCSVYNQSELIMLLKLTNHNQSRATVEGISLKIEPPSNLVVDMSSTEFIVEKLSFLETISEKVPMKYQYPATRMLFKGTLRYSVSKNSKVLNFEQEVPARHLFRPLTMSTEQFGEKWTSTGCDVRKHVTMTSRRSCEEVVTSVAKYIRFEAVDIKGSEAILAGSILGNDVCLLHVNVASTNLELWIKSSGKKLSEMVMKECLSACERLN